MCIPGVETAVAAMAASSIGQAVAIGGTAISAIGAIQQGRATQAAMQQQAKAVENQDKTQRQLSSIEEWRTREKMRRETRQQQAEIGARGIDMNSPTAIYLGQSAAEEMAFAGAAIRQNSAATSSELTAQRQALEMRGRNAMMKGMYSAAGTVLTDAPDLWPELLS